MPFPKSRRYPRIKIREGIAVECTEDGRAYRATVRNLGGGGLFIDMPAPMAQDRKLHVQFRPGRGLPAVEADVKVRYRLEGEGNGVEFTSIRPTGRQEILRLILRRLRAGEPPCSVRFVAQVEHPGGMFLGFSAQFGEDGLLVETKETLVAGSPVSVRFRPDEDGPLILAKGKIVCAVENFGIAVEF